MNLMLENNFLQRETKIFLVAFDAKGELKKLVASINHLLHLH